MPINVFPLDPRRDEDDLAYELVDVSEGGLDFQAPTLEDAPAEDDMELEQFVKTLYGEDA